MPLTYVDGIVLTSLIVLLLLWNILQKHTWQTICSFILIVLLEMMEERTPWLTDFITTELRRVETMSSILFPGQFHDRLTERNVLRLVSIIVSEGRG